ncbi:MAG: cytidine deaminase [Alphaproteobacteria bacterium]|nr:cytidine deaminase [Alphaproteobacteria bacterium]
MSSNGEDTNGDGGTPATDSDLALAEAARAAIARLYAENRHHIGSALRTRSGRIFTAVHLDTYVGRASVCAEAVALGRAIAEGESEIEAIVSVRHPRPAEADRTIRIVSPCGICREMLADFAPGSRVIVPGEEGPVGVPVDALLPRKYSVPKRRNPRN